jgi:hypothetical protein
MRPRTKTQKDRPPVANSKDKQPVRELVGILADRTQFEKAVDGLAAAGFSRADLSVLSSHDSIDAAGREPKSWRSSLVALLGELRYEGPLVAAGLIALAAGPVGAIIATAVAAGVGGVAVKELLDEVTSVPDSEDFARALAAGSIILWVCVDNEAQELKARGILTGAGATNIHIHERSGQQP